jgi:hypothetical protein
VSYTYFSKIGNNVNKFFVVRENFPFNISVNLTLNAVHVNSTHCRSPFFFILYHFILKINYILERFVILNISTVHDIQHFVSESKF